MVRSHLGCDRVAEEGWAGVSDARQPVPVGPVLRGRLGGRGSRANAPTLRDMAAHVSIINAIVSR
jgi:hypothetical protein